MKKAVISTGGKQYLVSEGDTISVELLDDGKKEAVFEPLLLIDGEKTTIGTPLITGSHVKVSIVNSSVQQDKVTSIRYKAKKRVRKIRGHRQKLSEIKITSIK